MKSFFVGILLNLAATVHAVADLPLPPYRDDNTEMATIRETWSPEKFTSPLQHNPKKFSYVIHMIDGLDLSPWAAKLIADPGLISGNYRICSSVIDETFTGTFYGKIGFILDVPKINVGVMHYDDMASASVQNYSGGAGLIRALLRERFSAFYTPSSLVEATLDNGSVWNEVILLGTIPHEVLPEGALDSKVKANGILLHCGKNSRELFKRNSSLSLPSAELSTQIHTCLKDTNRSQFSDQLLQTARRLTLPVLFLP